MIRYFPPGGRPQPVSGISDIGSGGRPTSGNLFAMGRPYGQVAPRSAYTGPVTITPADVYREYETETRLAKDKYLKYLDEPRIRQQEADRQYQELMKQYQEAIKQSNLGLASISEEFESRYGTSPTEEYLLSQDPNRPQLPTPPTVPELEPRKSFSDFLKTYSRGQYKVNPQGMLYMGTYGNAPFFRSSPRPQPQQPPRPVFGFLGGASAPRSSISSYAAR